jgi:galactonate dehydratase
MKLVDLELIPVDNIQPYLGGQKWLFVKLRTDEGIVGLGERVMSVSTNFAPQMALLEDMWESHVIGQDPFNIELIWQRVFASRHDYRHPSMDSTPALSAIEMALWDIVGKATGQPIYNLLGGRFHEQLRAYAYLPIHGIWEEIWEQPQMAGEVATAFVAAGWSATKLDPFSPLFPFPRDWPLEYLKRAASIFGHIRDAVGPGLEIGLGTHGQFSTAGAIRVAKVFEEYEPMWFEEPVPPENVAELARVAAHTSIPIAAGERLATKYEFADLVEKQAAGIVQLDVGQCGGILEAKKIAAIAEAHYALIAPHMYCGPVAAAAAVQLATCSPNLMLQEWNTTSLHSEILVEPITVERGFITPPVGPGLGIELNDDVVRRQRSS